jgi:deazaflavin-dependent oxidoreductase (nitroreductase family)
VTDRTVEPSPGTDVSKPRLPPRWFIRLAWVVHRAIYRVTGGRRGLRLPAPGRYGMLRLTTVGRRSGKERAVILGYYEDGPNLVTLAMNGWGAGEPAWWLNLRARGEAQVVLKSGARAVRSRAAEGEERQRLWDGFESYAGWGDDLDAFARLRPTETTVVVLEPQGHASARLLTLIGIVSGSVPSSGTVYAPSTSAAP